MKLVFIGKHLNIGIVSNFTLDDAIHLFSG